MVCSRSMYFDICICTFLFAPPKKNTQSQCFFLFNCYMLPFLSEPEVKSRNCRNHRKEWRLPSFPTTSLGLVRKPGNQCRVLRDDVLFLDLFSDDRIPKDFWGILRNLRNLKGRYVQDSRCFFARSRFVLLATYSHGSR